MNILGEELERVTHSKFLGTSVEEECDMETEITKRVRSEWNIASNVVEYIVTEGWTTGIKPQAGYSVI